VLGYAVTNLGASSGQIEKYAKIQKIFENKGLKSGRYLDGIWWISGDLADL
jgi:hypothetical protein